MVRLWSPFITVLLLSVFNTAHALNVKTQTFTCISFYQPNVSSYFKNIQSLDDKKKKDTQWLSFPKGDPETQALVERLISISPAQRNVLHPQALKHTFNNREFRRVILLALFDKDTWFEFIDRAMKGPLLDDSLVNSLIPVIRAMPENLKADVLAKVTPGYSKLSKVNFTKFPLRTNLRLAPKRSIDALILHIIKPDEWFKQDYELTHNALETYTRYLQFLKTDIFKNSDRGNYSTPEIMTVAEAIQKVLQDNVQKFNGPASITVTGSFPNGRAKISDTDLDSRISHQEMHALLDTMSESVNQAMKVYPYPSKFTVEAMWATTTAHFAAQINPLFLRITPSEIQVEVYSSVQPLHKDSVLMEYNYEAPTRYTLKENTFTSSLNPISTIVKRSDVDGHWLTEQVLTGLADFSFTVQPSKKPKTSPTAHQLVEAALKVSGDQQLDLLFTLRKSTSSLRASKDAQKLVKLALFGTAEWESFVRDAAERPQSNDVLFNALVPAFKKMPEGLSNDLKKIIMNLYPSVSDKAWIRKGILFKKVYGILSPRDALDVIANQILPPKDFIEAKIKEGETLEYAYNSFIARQHEQLYKKTKTMSAYSSADVKAIAQKVQDVVKKNPELFGPEGVQIVGRFPNGRAIMSDLSIEFLVADPLNKTLARELTYALNGKTKPSSKNFIEVDIKRIETTTIKEAIVNPIQIKVTKDDIQVHLHSPIQNMDRDRYQLPKNYPAPAIYPLNQNAVAELKEAS